MAARGRRPSQALALWPLKRHQPVQCPGPPPPLPQLRRVHLAAPARSRTEELAVRRRQAWKTAQGAPPPHPRLMGRLAWSSRCTARRRACCARSVLHRQLPRQPGTLHGLKQQQKHRWLRKRSKLQHKRSLGRQKRKHPSRRLSNKLPLGLHPTGQGSQAQLQMVQRQPQVR